MGHKFCLLLAATVRADESLELLMPDELQATLGLVLARLGFAHAHNPFTILTVARFGSNASGSNQP
jgi:hypothetical protein